MARKIKNGPNRTQITLRGEAEDGKLRFGAFFFITKGRILFFSVSGKKARLCNRCKKIFLLCNKLFEKTNQKKNVIFTQNWETVPLRFARGFVDIAKSPLI